MRDLIFPPWVNRFLPVLAIFVVVGGGYGASMFYVGAHPKTLNIGYQPKQPVPFSHKLHAGDLKMDCRYCHNTVDKAAHAAVPPTATCINCHSGKGMDGETTFAAVKSDSKALLPVRESWATGKAVEWTRVHDLADFVYFNHSAHVMRGVSCVSCHGRVDKMEVVTQVEDLSMAWCLTCHRNPAPHLRPLDQVTNLAWGTEAGGGFLSDAQKLTIGQKIQEENNIHPPTNCSTCHR